MRFDDQSYLDDWRAHRRFPQIHDDIYQMAAEELTGTSAVDLCCNIGLLGQRLHEGLGLAVCGIEMDRSALDRGTAAGLTYERLELKLTPTSLPAALDFLQAHRVTVLVARRCLSEIFVGHKTDGWPGVFARALKEIGIKEAVIQGRAPTSVATHEWPNVEAEISGLTMGGSFRLVRKVGQCAYLKSR